MLTSSTRLLRLLALLQTRNHWMGPELAERLEVHPRTLRRDIDRLRQLGYPVHASSGVAGGYAFPAGQALPPLLLDDDEALAASIALRTATAGGGRPCPPAWGSRWMHYAPPSCPWTVSGRWWMPRCWPRWRRPAVTSCAWRSPTATARAAAPNAAWSPRAWPIPATAGTWWRGTGCGRTGAPSVSTASWGLPRWVPISRPGCRPMAGI